jgi:predicted ATPase
LQTARELGERILTLAQSTQKPAHLALAHYLLGSIFFPLGELALSRVHLEQCITLYDRQQLRSHVLQEPIVCLAFTARALWFLGYPDQALKMSHEVLSRTRELSHPFSLAFVLDFAAAWLHQLRREEQAAQEWAEAAIKLSTERGFALTLAVGTWLRGWALAEQGQREEGIAQMREGLAAWRATGSVVWEPYFLAMLAETYGKVGQTEEGMKALAEALATVDNTGERLFEAELYRLKGTLTLQQANQKAKGKRQKAKIETDPQSLTPDPQGEAEACFLKAIEIARKQQAKSLELRAATSLARLWQQQGKQHEARIMLAEIYGWFTEGFDTKDLQDAKALLDELS